MPRKFKVGIVGTGHGVRTIAPALLSSGKFEVVAVSGSSLSRTEKVISESLPFAQAKSFEHLLEMESLDLICVASPNEFHLEHMIEAARVKRHLYLEKPIANSTTEAIQVQSAMIHRPPELLTVVGHQLRFNPFFKEIMKRWKSGTLGNVYSVVIRQRGGAFTSPEKPWTWEFEKNRGGGVRLAMGTHLIDLVNFLSGKTPNSTFINMNPVHETRSPIGLDTERRVDVSNFFSASLDYGAFEAYVTTSAASHGPGTFELEVLGSKGSIYFDGLGNLSYFISGTLQPSWFTNEQISAYQQRPGSSIFRKSLSVLADEIAKAINGEKSMIKDAASIDESVDLLRILDEAMINFNLRDPNRNKMF